MFLELMVGTKHIAVLVTSLTCLYILELMVGAEVAADRHIATLVATLKFLELMVAAEAAT